MKRGAVGRSIGIVALGASLLLPADAWAAGGDLLWKKRFDLAGGRDVAVSVAVEGGRVFAAGYAMNAGGNFDAVVRAYNAKTGKLLWMNQFDLAGDEDWVGSVAVDGGRVFAVIQAVNANGNWDLIARAYDAQSGTPVWTSQFDLAGSDDYFLPLAVRGGRVYAGGYSANSGGNYDFMVRAYDAQNGTLVWTNQFDLAGGDDGVTALAVRGGRVYASGFGSNGVGNWDYIVRAYDAQNGTPVWTDQFDLAGGEDSGGSLVVRGGRVFVGGLGTNAAGNWDWLVRAYDAPTGALLWMDQFGSAVGQDEATALSVRNGRVYAGGYAANATGNSDFVLRAYEAPTGDLLWMDQFDTGDNDSAWSVAVRGGRVFAAGTAGNSGSNCGFVTDDAGNCDFVVRAYDVATSDLVWMDKFDLAGAFDLAAGVVVRNGKVFVVGRGTNGNGDQDFLVRAYDAK